MIMIWKQTLNFLPLYYQKLLTILQSAPSQMFDKALNSTLKDLYQFRITKPLAQN